MFSCTSVLESESPIVSQEEQISEQVLTIKATIGETNETKTAVQSDGVSIYWTPGDAINLFYGTASAGQFTTAIESPALTTDFSGTLSVATGTSTESGVTTQNFWGVYPYNVSNTCTGDGVTLTIPSTQSGIAGSFADKLNPSVATSPGLSLAFYNVGSWFIFSVTEPDIVSATLTGHNNENLAGRVKVTMDAETHKPVTEVLDGQTSITMTPAGGTFEVGESYYMVVIPGRMSSGLELTLTKNNGTQATWSINSDVTFTRSMYLRKLNADNGLTFVCKEPLTFTSIGSTTVTIQKNNTPDDVILEYRIGYNEWELYTIGLGIALLDGESLQFRAGEQGNEHFSKDYSNYFNVVVGGDGSIEASGNIMSLLDRDLLRNDLPEYAFKDLFSNCTKLSNVDNLLLPAISLAEGCYNRMFYGCTGLNSAPALPATSLAAWCYQNMFYGCTGLTSAPVLPATTLATGCYYQMFYNCPGLTSAPALPATTLAESCYCGMFSACTGLKSAPALPATTLAEECYREMFRYCTELTSVPTLPATTLTRYCYSGMFSHCTGLTSAPVLPATTLVEHCYSYMFEYCSNLNYIKILATDISASQCLYYWVLGGVSATGTFVKNPSATWNKTGSSGVPSGWTVLTSIPTPEAVDLGLSSGIKWASFNIGASSPEGYGDYFAWAETQPYYLSGYAQSISPVWKTGKSAGYATGSYQWKIDNHLSKYCPADMGTYWNSLYCGPTPDDKTEFSDANYEDDAARVLLGDNWRTPTIEEWEELISSCDWTWTTQNEVNGMLVTSKVNDKSIFLPASGTRSGTSLSSLGTFGSYWSSSVRLDYPYDAYYVFIRSDGAHNTSFDSRYHGSQIRPVL